MSETSIPIDRPPSLRLHVGLRAKRVEFFSRGTFFIDFEGSRYRLVVDFFPFCRQVTVLRTIRESHAWRKHDFGAAANGLVHSEPEIDSAIFWHWLPPVGKVTIGFVTLESFQGQCGHQLENSDACQVVTWATSS